MRRTRKNTQRIIERDIWISRDDDSDKIFLSQTKPISCMYEKGIAYLTDDEKDDSMHYCNHYMRHFGLYKHFVPPGTYCKVSMVLKVECFDNNGNTLTFDEIEKFFN